MQANQVQYRSVFLSRWAAPNVRLDAVFIKPEPGRVGLGETEARQGGIAVRVATVPMAAVLRARTLSETRGFMKAVVDVDNDSILGFAMLGAKSER
jgi:probable pyridine nucleotide-disulfide oxidoreductase